MNSMKSMNSHRHMAARKVATGLSTLWEYRPGVVTIMWIVVVAAVVLGAVASWKLRTAHYPMPPYDENGLPN